MDIYSRIKEKSEQGKKQLAVLVDPDKHKVSDFLPLASKLSSYPIDYFLIGGSLLSKDLLDECLLAFKEVCNIPLIIFPGGVMQINPKADALLFLSLISGRNAELLIGKQVESVPYILHANIEPISTGYILVDGGSMTTAQYISNTLPVPANKPDIAALTAKAGEMIGMKMIYLDAGSGAKNSVSKEMICKVRAITDLPLMVGGGIRSAEAIQEKIDAGADLVVIGTAIENDLAFLDQIKTIFNK
ncbi:MULTISPECIES: geranylgeranylglyceryl/heptaprenylglyceryl phosphate synthase [unclassified Lentimicrobium]|uniref:geranylgeranylglyceryl/heptaprenylglyceryl phosphate synthase n=1 Tax=unclassified Lentimicrobium TaxID=2677434 RepID=UPI0015581431|nr:MULTISPECIES: geranylgeranylglyceryl/heptaprenylglyceryl phosphate synthase [unclassified Lentimicrobium]NPD46061.1 geranylgeranylglyceryl/heptaprenylglyceryl phosphate synthase [Lentimicrobium sp. S6]NPD84965.1 geranylgeranylglyceryl/heptaprenylglyceryl phosphate synthase [Lentimicrobium sp. L6]